MLDSVSFRKGLRDSVVILFAVGAFGVAYGVLAVDAGFSPWLATVSSVLIVSGAAQFTMIGLLSGGAIPVLLAATVSACATCPCRRRWPVSSGRSGWAVV